MIVLWVTVWLVRSLTLSLQGRVVRSCCLIMILRMLMPPKARLVYALERSRGHLVMLLDQVSHLHGRGREAGARSTYCCCEIARSTWQPACIKRVGVVRQGSHACRAPRRAVRRDVPT